MIRINEGMRPKDLSGMVRSVVSVDCYESKIDDSSVVVAFSVSDQQAAEDVNRFIQKSYVELLDTEVSAAPDQKGFYLVFVEILNNDKLPGAVASICGDLSPLCDIKKWSVDVRGNDLVVNLLPSEIEQVISKSIEKPLAEFFHLSELDQVIVNEGVWSAVKDDNVLQFVVCDFGSIEKVSNRNRLYALKLDESSQATNACASIESMFGTSMFVQKSSEYFIISNASTNKMLVISLQ